MRIQEYQHRLATLPFGKRLPRALYVYREAELDLGTELNNLVEMLVKQHELGTAFNVLKFRTDELKVSFLSYRNFIDDPHPPLGHAVIGIKTGKLDDQSFFLDSVFAPCDEVYAGIVARFLPGKARQMLLLVASQQWHEAIRLGIEPEVDRAYCFKLHTSNPERKLEEYEVSFKKRRFSLLAKLPASEEAYSSIEEVK